MCWLLVLVSFGSAALAIAPTVQQDWIFPAAPSGTSNVTTGSLSTISWTQDLQQWFSSYCPSCDPTKVDLWAQTGNDDNYAYKIAIGVNVAYSYSFPWPVNIPASDLITDPEWVLRFIPYNATLTSTSQQISSALFYVNRAAVAVTNSTSSAAPTSSSSMSSSSSTSATTSATQTNAQSASPTPNPGTGGLSTGAQAGIGAGVGVAALLFIAALVMYARSRRSSRRKDPRWLGPRQYSEKEPPVSPTNPDHVVSEPEGEDRSGGWTSSIAKDPPLYGGLAELSSGTPELPGDRHHLTTELSGEERPH